MSSYDDIMAESRRHAALQIRRKNEANAAAWARCHPNTPPPRTKTTFLFFEWDAFDVFCCAPQACAMEIHDPPEGAECDGFDDATPVLLDVEIDKTGGSQGGGGAGRHRGRVHEIQLEAQPDEPLEPPTMSPATSDLPKRWRPGANSRLSGTWDDDLSLDRSVDRNVDVFVEDPDEVVAADAAAAAATTQGRGAAPTVTLTRDAPATPVRGHGSQEHQSGDISTPLASARRASSTKRATSTKCVSPTGHVVRTTVSDPVAAAGPPPVDAGDADGPPGATLPPPPAVSRAATSDDSAAEDFSRDPTDAKSLLEALLAVDGDFKRSRGLARAARNPAFGLTCADLPALLATFDLTYHKIKALCRLHPKLEDREANFDAALDALFVGASRAMNRDRVRQELGLPKLRPPGTPATVASS